MSDPTSSASTARFVAPGPGEWTIDTGHFPRPATWFTAELFPEPSRQGFAEGAAAFGLLLDYLEWAFVEGWGYLSPRPVPALRHAGRLTRPQWDQLVGSTPELQARLAVSARAFEDRVWRRDLALWDDELEPALIAGHLGLQAVDPDALSDDDLLTHLHHCRENLRVAIRTHHRFDVTPVVPVGELLVRCREWTGAPAVEVLALLRGAGPLAVGAPAELARAAAAIRGDAAARATLTAATDPAESLSRVLATPGPVGQATSAYVDLVGNWSAGRGFDIDEPTLREMPGLLVESLRVAVEGDARVTDDSPASVQAVRDAVPGPARAEFDDVLGEARLVHRLRDGRALYCDVWANGLMRRAVLAAGRRLTSRGLIGCPVHLVEAGWSELRSLLGGGDGNDHDPGLGEDLAARARGRAEADPGAVPVELGRPTSAPVPTAWLAPGPARTENAFRTYLGAMAEEEPGAGSDAAVRGVAASPGRYEGRARVVRGPSGIGAVREGDVLVAESTSPAFNVVLPLIGAVVTDEGGMLSHAAIVAREFGIPAVVGTEAGTGRIPDGATVLVDGTVGEVMVIARPD